MRLPLTPLTTPQRFHSLQHNGSPQWPCVTIWLWGPQVSWKPVQLLYPTDSLVHTPLGLLPSVTST